MAIKLEKQGDTHRIDLTKNKSSVDKEITINLNWSQTKQSVWSKLSSGDKSIDLDLGCWYELRDGTKRCIDGLQFAQGNGGRKDQVTNQGCYTQKPWIWHTGDDRSGSSIGENILINPKGIGDIKRLTIYCFIYEGVAKWVDTNAVVTVKVSNCEDIIVEMGQQNDPRKFCVVAEILFEEDDSLIVQKAVTFHIGHKDCDLAYKWGMKWVSGSK